MRKVYLLFISIAIVLSIAIGCEKTEPIQKGPKIVNFYYQDGTPALTVAKLAKENPKMDEMITVNYEMQKSPDLLVAKVLKEEADIAIVPSNLAAQAYNKDLGYKIVGTSTWGTMYLTSTEDIVDIDGLVGKEIYSFGKGLTPDLVLRYILSNNGIDPEKDVKITYLNSAAELGPAFLSGKTNLAVLPEPLLTTVMMKNKEAKVIMDLNEEWSRATGAEKGFPQSSLIIKTDLIENDSEFVKTFIKNYEESRKWVTEDPEGLAEYAEALGFSIPKEIIKKSINWPNIDSFNIKDSIEEYQIYYKAILDFAPDFIGGQIPDEELFFER